MKIPGPKVRYDGKTKILSIRLSSQKSVDSDVKGNVVLDYDGSGNLVNIDIMRVSLAEFRRTALVRDLLHAGHAA